MTAVRHVVFAGGPLDGTTMQTCDRVVLVAERPPFPLPNNTPPQVAVVQRVGRYCSLDEVDPDGLEIYDWKGWEG